MKTRNCGLLRDRHAYLVAPLPSLAAAPHLGPADLPLYSDFGARGAALLAKAMAQLTRRFPDLAWLHAAQ